MQEGTLHTCSSLSTIEQTSTILKTKIFAKYSSKDFFFSDDFSGLAGARRKSSVGEDEKNEVTRENVIEFEIVGQPKD